MSDANKETLSEGFFSMKRMTSSNEVETTDVEIANAKNIIMSRAKDIVDEYNKNSSIKKKIREDIDSTMKLFENDNFDGFDSNRNVPKLICYIYNETETSMILSIYDGSQPMRVALSSTIKNIKQDLMKDKKIKSLCGLNSISTGDGDEGCLFIEFKK